ncbi:ribonuclease R [Luteitalea sp.]|uniref:ribonuclease R n=1 Tax=Luteitalea sp. TaxID=2004800 RepID=UPI000B042A16|nr:ribonuclease R [Luteitalea sp.]
MTPDDLLHRIRERVTHPSTVKELMRALKLPKTEAPGVRRALKTLVDRGALIETRGRHFGVPELMDLAPGRITVHPNGFGFVKLDQPIDEVTGDIYVAGHNLHDAMHGDRVLVRVERHGRDGRSEGRIVRILERSAATTVGRYDKEEHGLQYVTPFDKRLLMDVQIPAGDELGATPGQMVVIEVTRWPVHGRGALGRVIEIIGDLEAPGVDTQIIIRKHGIPDRHSDESIAEATRLGIDVDPKDIEGRTDFRGDVVVTIDGETARDFDDAISVERLANGHYLLKVHIADVAHYVHEGSALDTEAAERSTSVYFPERAVHMFPEELATGLCSLRPHVDRLVQSCVMEIDARGLVVESSMHDGVIVSRARMTYNEVAAILDGDEAQREKYRELVPHFERMRELFVILNQRRHRRGSIDFDLPEAKIVLDSEGQIENILVAERNVAHRLIEECMLVANETVAAFLESNDVPTLYRIHEAPDPLKVEQFEEFISTLGYSLSAGASTIKPRHFQKLVEKLRGKPEERPIATLVLRTMQKARYDTQCHGHFGLAADAYAHFTSPIRRYPDLIVHRTLREFRHGLLSDALYEERTEELPELGRHTSEMERRADEAENELVAWKKVRFMADKVGEEYNGFITGVAPFGLFVQLVEHYVEGLVHISSLADDYYRHLERVHQLRGENTHRVFRLGDPVRVQVLRVDQDRRQVDLGVVEVLDRIRESERNRGPRTSKAGPKAKAGSRPPTKGRPGKRERAVKKAVRRRK